MNVGIIGAGWAGLAAGVALARQGISVTVLEAASQAGGRARSLPFGTTTLDNGQHILLGAYRATLELLRQIGVPESAVLRRQPLQLQLHRRDGAPVQLPPRRGPAATLRTLLGMRGIAWRDRLAALRFALHARQARLTDPDRPALDVLRAQGQSDAIIQAVWEPLCVAALNTPIAESSARLFLTVLRDALLSAPDASDLLLPVTDLGACLPIPAQRFIESRGGSVRLRQRVTAVTFSGDRVTGVQVDDELVMVDQLVIATGPAACARLLTHPSLAPIRDGIAQLRPSPIATLYVRYPASLALDREFVGLLGGSVQWLFDRGRLTGEHGLIAAVVSGPNAHMHLSPEAATAAMIAEIHAYFPHWPAPLETKLIREKSATFAAHPDVDRYRPSCRTPVRGLWLAGDYTATGYPGTLEGAVRSGVECATALLRAS